MWIVEVALRRPYTFIVLALLVPLIGALTIMGTPLRSGMPTDIFPDIKIPVIAVTFQYAGMPPDEMAGRITAQIERYATTIVNDIEHVESQSYPGMAVIKIFFQPGVDINLAMAQVTAFGQLSLRLMPPGVQPPLILKYNAATVPIIQLAMSSNTLTEAQLFDFGNQVVRTQIATVYGAAIPYPFGGAARQIQVDLKPDALRAQGLTANDVNNAITNQNLIVPAGTQKIGDTESPNELQSRERKIRWGELARPERELVGRMLARSEGRSERADRCCARGVVPRFHTNRRGRLPEYLLVAVCKAPSRVWSVGPSATVPLLDFGARSAANQQARASPL